jgi:4-amino-4-deoxy-L-arabinose transferase-like glycosyltransferase
MQKEAEKKDTTVKFLLILILAVTFILAVKQAVPFFSLDELELMDRIQKLDRDLFPVIHYAPLFIYLHYILSMLYGFILSLLGVIGSSSFFLFSDTGFGFTLAAGRMINALLAVLTVYVVYKTGKEFFNRAAGLTAALLTGVNSLLILYAHVFKPEITVTLLMTLTLYFILKYRHSQKTVYILFSAFFYGLSTAAKFNAFPLVLVIVLAILLTSRPIPKAFLFLPLGAAAGFFLGAPNWLVRPLGNLKENFSLFAPDIGATPGQFEIRTLLETHGEFFQDLIRYFGLIFLIIFAAGVLIGFLTRNKRDMLLSCFIIIYIVVFVSFGYYAGRFTLPLYPAAALMMGKVLFVDIKKIFQRLKLLPRLDGVFKYAGVLLAIFLGFYALDRTIANVKTFNLLKTQSAWDRIIEYRERHNIDDGRYNVARQVFTPPFEKTNIKLTRDFQLKSKRDRQKKLHFIQAHLTTYNTFIDEKEKKDPRIINLSRYKPFYEIRERTYQPRDLGCVFLYRVPDQLYGVLPGNEETRLPRPFYRGRHTSFLPLQVYEQNPNYGKLENDNGTYEHWLYSGKEIKKIIVWLFSLRRHADLTIRVNGRGAVVKTRGRPPVERVDIENLQPLSFYYDYVYRVQVHSPQRRLWEKPYYFVLEPVYADEPEGGEKRPTLFPKPARGEIPPVFSNKPFPLWMIIFYKTTGIDLALLSHVGTHRLFVNTEKTITDVSIGYAALETGDYFLRVEGEKIVETQPPGSTVFLEYTYYGITGAFKNQALLTPLTGPDGLLFAAIPIEVKDGVGFVKFDIKGLRQNNLLVRQVNITPDYQTFVNKHLVRKGK